MGKKMEFAPWLPQKTTPKEPHLTALQTHSVDCRPQQSKLSAAFRQQELPPQAPRGTNHDGKDTQDQQDKIKNLSVRQTAPSTKLQDRSSHRQEG